MQTILLNNGFLSCPRSVSASSRHPPTRPATPSRRHSAPATATSTPRRPTATSARWEKQCTVWTLNRLQVFLETKIWISDYGYDETLHGFEKSARKLGVDQIDLLILHQPLPSVFY